MVVTSVLVTLAGHIYPYLIGVRRERGQLPSLRSNPRGSPLERVHEKQRTTPRLVANDRRAELDRTGEEACTATPASPSFWSGLMERIGTDLVQNGVLSEGEMWFAFLILIVLSLVLVVMNLVQWRKSKKKTDGPTGNQT